MCWRAIRPLASINPLHLNIKMYILHTVFFIYQGADKENLCNKEVKLKLVIIVYIVVILMCDSGVIL